MYSKIVQDYIDWAMPNFLKRPSKEAKTRITTIFGLNRYYFGMPQICPNSIRSFKSFGSKAIFLYTLHSYSTRWQKGYFLYIPK